MSSLRKRDEIVIPVRLYSAWFPMSQQEVHWCHDLSERPRFCVIHVFDDINVEERSRFLKQTFNHIANAFRTGTTFKKILCTQNKSALYIGTHSIVHVVFYRVVHVLTLQLKKYIFTLICWCNQPDWTII